MIFKPPPPNRLLRRREVERVVGLKKSQIYALMADGAFPRPVRIGKRAVAWPEQELNEWRNTLPRAGSFAPGGNT
ncbi:AlpA family phage regulatory protein [Erythrobacter aurantius]|uniref:AlpA family phage regulatory protein n=1 Tax=Erythrobacter aurantius TaxID=2909249 RepID=UPI0020794398|nr:AlpA family phage regulatory protein [Erythrobacter aurantius]